MVNRWKTFSGRWDDFKGSIELMFDESGRLSQPKGRWFITSRAPFEKEYPWLKEFVLKKLEELKGSSFTSKNPAMRVSHEAAIADTASYSSFDPPEAPQTEIPDYLKDPVERLPVVERYTINGKACAIYWNNEKKRKPFKGDREFIRRALGIFESSPEKVEKVLREIGADYKYDDIQGIDARYLQASERAVFRIDLILKDTVVPRAGPERRVTFCIAAKNIRTSSTRQVDAFRKLKGTRLVPEFGEIFDDIYYEEWISGPRVGIVGLRRGLSVVEIRKITATWMKIGRILSEGTDFKNLPSDLHAGNIMFRKTEEDPDFVAVDLYSRATRAQTPATFIDDILRCYVNGKSSTGVRAADQNDIESVLLGILDGFDNDKEEAATFLNKALGSYAGFRLKDDHVVGAIRQFIAKLEKCPAVAAPAGGGEATASGGVGENPATSSTSETVASMAKPIDETVVSKTYKKEFDPLAESPRPQPLLTLQGKLTVKDGVVLLNGKELQPDKNLKGDILGIRTNIWRILTMEMEERGLGSFDLNDSFFNLFVPQLGSSVARLDELLMNALMSYLTPAEIESWQGKYSSSQDYLFALFSMLKSKPVNIDIIFELYPKNKYQESELELEIVNHQPLADKDRKKLNDAFSVFRSTRDEKEIEEKLRQSGILTEHRGKGLAGIVIGLSDYISLFRFQELPEKTEQTVRLFTSWNILTPSCLNRINAAGDTRSPSVPDKPSDGSGGGAVGGIDFRSLPIVTQAINNLNAGAGSIPLPRLNSVDLDSEWREIEQFVSAGITPSGERIKEYLQASCYGGNIAQDKQKIVLCISDILRQEEEHCCATEPVLRDILIVLESGSSPQELKAVFTGIKS